MDCIGIVHERWRKHAAQVNHSPHQDDQCKECPVTACRRAGGKQVGRRLRKNLRRHEFLIIWVPLCGSVLFTAGKARCCLSLTAASYRTASYPHYSSLPKLVFQYIPAGKISSSNYGGYCMSNRFT